MKKIFLLTMLCFLTFTMNVKADDKAEIDQFTNECAEMTTKEECNDAQYCTWNSLNKCAFDYSKYSKNDDNTDGVNDSSTNDGATYNEGDMLRCGSIDNIPARLPKIVSTVYNIIKVVVPIVIIIFGMLDLLKAVMAQKEDEIKKGQHIFIKRLLTGAIVFFVFIIVQLAVGLVSSGTENADIMSCMNCFLNNKCK